MSYFRVIIWKPEHDDFVRRTYSKIFGKSMGQKTPRQDRITGNFLIGTANFTEQREEEMRALLRGKGKVLNDVPKLWWDVIND